MKKHLFVLIFLISLPFAANASDRPINISIEPSVGHGFGETEYIMNFRTYLTDENGDIVFDNLGNPVIMQIKSQLEYPLDVVMAGVNLRLSPNLDPGKWSVEAGVFTSLSDPGGAMKDSDWEGIDNYFDLTKWSYTESSAKMNSILFNAQATYRVLAPGKLRISALAGFRYHRIEQDLFGVDGWQRTFDDVSGTFDEPEFFSLLADEQVLYYEVKFTMPQVGLLATIDFSDSFSGAVKTVLAPTWFKDVDDHPLRNKLSTAEGSGTGFIGSLDLRYQSGNWESSVRPYVDFFVEYTSIRTDGDQTQSWYGDDPASPDFDDTGYSVDGVPHDVNATLYNVGLKVGLTF